MGVNENLRVAAMNRHRKRVFGDAELTIFETSPVDGETSLDDVSTDWFGHRVNRSTDGVLVNAASEWQFQVVAADDWESSQADYLKATVLTVGSGDVTRRWKVTKVEKPLPGSLVWKFKAQEQK